jgi:hypothetical protein
MIEYLDSSIIVKWFKKNEAKTEEAKVIANQLNN